MLRINHTIWMLLFSDIFVITGFGFVSPIIAVFISDQIRGGSIFTVGVATTVFYVAQSLTQLPFSRHVDTHDDRDDLKWLLRGTLLIAVVPAIYLLSTDMIHIYVAQLVYGIGTGLAYSTWLGLWSTHLDKRSESFEWSLHQTLVGLGIAVAATLGAASAEYIGFRATFVFVGVLALIGCYILYLLKKDYGRRFAERQAASLSEK